MWIRSLYVNIFVAFYHPFIVLQKKERQQYMSSRYGWFSTLAHQNQSVLME